MFPDGIAPIGAMAEPRADRRRSAVQLPATNASRHGLFAASSCLTAAALMPQGRPQRDKGDDTLLQAGILDRPPAQQIPPEHLALRPARLAAG